MIYFFRVLSVGLVLFLSGIDKPIAFGVTPAILTTVPSISYQSHNHITVSDTTDSVIFAKAGEC